MTNEINFGGKLGSILDRKKTHYCDLGVFWIQFKNPVKVENGDIITRKKGKKKIINLEKEGFSLFLKNGTNKSSSSLKKGLLVKKINS